MKSFRGIIFALISSGTFGLIPLFAIPLMNEDGMGFPSLLFYRFFLSAIIMGGICLLRKESFKINMKKQVPSLMLLGALYALTALFLTYSYKFIPSGVATTIHFLYPICVSFIMVFFFKERKSMALLVAAVLSLIGVGLLCWTGGASLNMMGVGVASITILTYAMYIVGINQFSAGNMSAEVLTFFILLSGAAIFFVFASATTGIEMIPSAGAGARLLLLAFVPTVISDLTLILAVKYAGSTITSILGSMEPTVAVLVGILYFSEDFSLNSFFGIVLILLSVALVILAGQRHKRKERKMETVEVPIGK